MVTLHEICASVGFDLNYAIGQAIWDYDTRWGQAAQRKLRRFERYGSRAAKSIIRKTTRKFPYISTVDLATFTHIHMRDERAFRVNNRRK